MHRKQTLKVFSLLSTLVGVCCESWCHLHVVTGIKVEGNTYSLALSLSLFAPLTPFLGISSLLTLGYALCARCGDLLPVAAA